jgi:hypothetical protein
MASVLRELDSDVGSTTSTVTPEFFELVESAAEHSGNQYFTASDDDLATFRSSASIRSDSLPSKAPKVAFSRGLLDISRLPAKNFYSNSSLIQEWEGYVESIGDTSFTAVIRDLTTSDDRAEELVELPLDDLSESDRKRISPGTIFRWSIGYHVDRSGTKSRASRIVLRHLPAWTKADLKKAHEEAERIASLLIFE